MEKNKIATSRIPVRTATSPLIDSDLMPSGVSNQLILNDILANRILIYDYNLLNTEVFEGIEVRPESIDEPEYFENNPNGAYSFVFKTVENKPVKRNKFI